MSLPEPRHPPHPNTSTEIYWGSSLTFSAPAWTLLRKHGTWPCSARPLCNSPRHLQQVQQQGTAPDSCWFCEKQTAGVRGETWMSPLLKKQPNIYWTLLADVRHCRKSRDHTQEAPGETSQALTPAQRGCSHNDSRVTVSWGFQALPYKEIAT